MLLPVPRSARRRRFPKTGVLDLVAGASLAARGVGLPISSATIAIADSPKNVCSCPICPWSRSRSRVTTVQAIPHKCFRCTRITHPVFLQHIRLANCHYGLGCLHRKRQDTIWIVRRKLSHLLHRVYLERIQDGRERGVWRGDKRDSVLARPLHHHSFHDLCRKVLRGVVPAAVPRGAIDEDVEPP
ncbi:hypothetical protein BRADI_4g04066v3 [Brachypodium distachyon]|uniref:Uncharacterized protein n=1 Tax=Brachypodium distachyon TaxID=15368 RepID=A0A2K2CKC7_BRADI|nr:hypothetical protein BRADI_4g04066v3 [Brachypodium distachyon]PNT62480.1 hypothetical protein BRADI_4g04066v3 [Brachypodium distachyon]